MFLDLVIVVGSVISAEKKTHYFESDLVCPQKTIDTTRAELPMSQQPKLAILSTPRDHGFQFSECNMSTSFK